jgi:glycerol-3-phosphate O-acyltransferase/dihydroxyacetone phosphate acyltransferase
LEFGSPITIPSELITAFKAGKEKLAVSALRRLVQSVLSEMTLLDSDSDDMIPKVIKAFTTLTPPPSIQETLQRKRHIVRRLRADIKVQSLDTCQNLTTRINQFNKELASFGIKSLPASGHATTLFLTLMKNILLLSLTTPLAAPGLLLFTPLLLASGYFARRHAARATATSAFRIRGHDVLASAKALYAVQMAPVLYGAFAWGISTVHSCGSFAGFGKPVIVVMGLVLVTVLGIVALPAGDVVMDAVAEVRDVVACLREAVWSEEGRVKMGRLVKMKGKLESEVERYLGEYEGEEGCMGDKPLF